MKYTVLATYAARLPLPLRLARCSPQLKRLVPIRPMIIAAKNIVSATVLFMPINLLERCPNTPTVKQHEIVFFSLLLIYVYVTFLLECVLSVLSGATEAGDLRYGLLLVFRVHADSNGAVVEQFYLHVGTELASAYRSAERIGQLAAELLVERNGNLVLGGAKP